MNTEKITKIEIYARGKNKDSYGNPYCAYKAVIYFSHVNYFTTITVTKPFTYYDSDERGCLELAILGINEAFGTNFKANDARIKMHYKHVTDDRALERPEAWKI